MKETVHRLFSILMAMLLLVSTTSWAVDKHYCMGHLMDVSFFANAKDCGMDMTPSDETSKTEEKSSCCDDETMVVDGQDNLKISVQDIDLGQQFFLVSFTYSYLNILSPIEELPVPNEHYPPPILVKNIHLLDEVFLI
ncbi:hypothetical protein ACEZ3G_08595 [Maribacter algicola]|uniref:Uncharacterized protein n=1 Tax=Meishania litoralis TaxID=3434685 RepID=A0ACC7LJ03_9FLAO